VILAGAGWRPVDGSLVALVSPFVDR